MEYDSDTFEQIKNENVVLKQDLEILNQELHECKKNVRLLQAVQVECQNEIDILQSEEIKQKQKYQEIIKQLEQSIHNMRASHNDEKLAFENVIMKMEEKNERMQAELEVFKETGINTTNFVGDTSLLIKEILYDPPEIYENQELKKTLSHLQETNEMLQKKTEAYETELEDLKECYACTKSDLQEANITIQFLNDEVCGLKSEIDSIKNQPLNQDSKGNSLFAEVDDRRVYLQDKIDKMKSSYIAKTQENAQLKNAAHQLRLENMRLLEKWKSDVEEKDEDQYGVIVTLKSRIDTLEKLIEKYKKELSEKPLIISSNSFEELEYYSLTLNEKNKEIQALKEEMNSKSLQRFMLSSELRESNEEKRKWRLEAMSKQHELDILKRELSKETESSTKQVQQEKLSFITSARKDVSRSSTETKKDSACEKKLEDSVERLTLTEQSPDVQRAYLDLSDDQKESDDFETSALSKEYHCVDHSVTNRRDTILIDKEHNNKENKPDNDVTTNQAKRVTFAVNTLSPKKTERRGGRRIFVGKPIHFKD
ncbi:protein Spindly-like [Diabrotica virgifera virgifera]|uniref:Protein Spindly n=2 Tax=Diabrotica virgifera virgifera TaxID=50390 RepID=A0ABM5KPT1_DIAVI|nr:protein Spindly-like [Diabrotica virgifera virgifera]